MSREAREQEIAEAHQAVVEQALAADRVAALRDAFAGGALSAMIATVPQSDRTQIDKSVWALQAYHFADVMMRVRELHPDMVRAKLSARGIKA